ncbi:MAG: hypothetical protein IEMM0008_0007 [bacterium]|nr:MAG: hypothetical protein IEMM0008_0007 [bacterium]
MNQKIILIGPIRSGKSTLGRLIAEKLGLPQYPIDRYRWKYYGEIGYDSILAREIGEKEGFLGVYKYWKPFEAHAVERLLSDMQNGVIDLGAGHSVFEDSTLFSRVQKALEPYNNVILLLPSSDMEESIQILNDRTGGFIRGGFDFHEHFVKHPSNHLLAKITHYTKNKSPEESRDELIAQLYEVSDEL